MKMMKMLNRSRAARLARKREEGRKRALEYRVWNAVSQSRVVRRASKFMAYRKAEDAWFWEWRFSH